MLSIIDCLRGLGVTMEPDAKPTIVLIHGAFADASGWSEVIQRLSALGYSAYAPANPLRGVISDGDYVRTFLSTIQGPVVLAGHSYGGSVITNASVGAPNVRALVYIAAYAPDEGETLAAAGALDGASNDLPGHLLVRPYPGMPDGDGDAYINPEFFHEQFCADLPDALAAVMAVSQRPVDAVVPGHAVRSGGLEDAAELVHGRQQRQRDPAGGGAGNGSPGRRAHGRGQQLPRCLHQPPAGDHRSHTGRRTGQLTPPPSRNSPVRVHLRSRVPPSPADTRTTRGRADDAHRPEAKLLAPASTHTTATASTKTRR